MLSETTYVIDDPYVYQFIESTLSAISLRDGFLHLDAAALPEALEAGQVANLIEETNRRLRKAGERIESINDLERVLELYDERKIEVPDT